MLEEGVADAVGGYVAQILGPVATLAVDRRPAGRVLKVASAADGRRWAVKTVTSSRLFHNEVAAYTDWVPRFAESAPRLHHVDEALRTMILTWVPGRSCGHTADPRDHRRAGRLLARIHAAAPPRAGGPSAGELLHGILERHVVSVGEHLTKPEIDIAATAVRQAQHLPPSPSVPCHGDYQGGNWIRGPRRLRVIDYAFAEWREPAFDLTRLASRAWWDRPDLREAFLTGYGRDLSDADQHRIRLHLPVVLLGALGRARRAGIGTHAMHGARLEMLRHEV